MRFSDLPAGAPLLAFDTATPVGSVVVAAVGGVTAAPGGEAVGEDDEGPGAGDGHTDEGAATQGGREDGGPGPGPVPFRVLAHGLLLRRGEHASHLVPRIDELLGEAGVERGDLEGLVTGRGPGSFTGVRIAAATARGLVAGLGVPLWTVSSLAAAAASFRTRLPGDFPVEPGPQFVDLPPEAVAWPRYVLFDARGDRVYAACYRFHSDRVETLVEPEAATLGEILEGSLPEQVLFCGDGALRHAPVLEERGLIVLPFPAGLPTGEGLLRVLARHPDVPSEPRGSRWEPDYLRGGRFERSAPRAGTGMGEEG